MLMAGEPSERARVPALQRLLRRAVPRRRRFATVDETAATYLLAPGRDTLLAFLHAADTALQHLAHRGVDDQTAAGVVQQAALAHAHAFSHLGGQQHADIAGDLLRRLMEHAPTRDLRIAAAVDLATLEFTRYTEHGELERLESSAVLYEQALPDCPVTMQPVVLNGLGNALVELSRWRDPVHLLDRAVRLHEEALSALPPTSPYRVALLVNQAQALLTRWQRLGDPTALDAAMTIHEDIQEHLSEPESVDAAVAVARAELLWERYAATGRPALLDEMQYTLEAVLESLPEDVPLWGAAALDLANTLLERRLTSGNDDQLDELLRRVAVATAPGSSNQVRLLNLLGVRGWQDHVRTGSLGALDEAVFQWRAAAENESDGDGTRGVVLNSLAIGLLQQAQPHRADYRAWPPSRRP